MATNTCACEGAIALDLMGRILSEEDRRPNDKQKIREELFGTYTECLIFVKATAKEVELSG